MRVNDMARTPNFNLNQMMGVGNSKKINPSSPFYEKRYTPIEMDFIEPNFDKIATKSTPSMSDDGFKEAIKNLAQKEASQGILAATDEKNALLVKYMAVVSPDRKAAYKDSMSKTGGKMNALNGFYDNSGNRLMHYNKQSKAYMIDTTKEELERMREFNDIYREAFQAYETINGKVNGTPTIKRN